MKNQTIPALVFASLAATFVACGGGGAVPELSPIPDQVAQVGAEFTVQLIATDEDGDAIDYSFASDVPDIRSRATLTRSPTGAGIFRWTPLASDVGVWYFDFTASDGSNEDTITVKIDVRSAIGVNSAPVFREPLGTGTTLDLSTTPCIELNIVIEDQDSTSVTIAQDEPIIAGAEIVSTGGLTGRWSWCPTRAQIDADDRYTLTLTADDNSNPKTTKHYLIVLRKEPKDNCPGEPPVVTHSAMNANTVIGLTIDATVTDDAGLKREPLLYYGTTAPADPPDLGAMTQTTMLLIDGTMQNGVWAADVPNPVATMPAGSTATLYYVFVANDDDDTEGDCDHVTQAPATGTYSMTVTNPGGAGGAPVCAACTADIQCGGASDYCVRVGMGGDSYCLKGCTSSSQCGSGYECSASPVTSVEGAMGRQCVPLSGTCTAGGGGTCTDDSYEDNDTLAQASMNPALATGTYNLVSCEAASGDDEDWFKISITTDSTVTVNVAGTSASDLDLGIYNADGSSVKTSMGLTSTESVTSCLTPGTYYIRVFAWGPKQNAYALTYSRTSMTCTTAMCTDDANEPDDTLAQARATIYPIHTATNQKICPMDDDWYEVELYYTEKVIVDLTFNQTNSLQDLDLHFHNFTGTDLTPCDEETDPFSCTASQGQSATSNEHYEYTEQASPCNPCTYFVRVHGWEGSTNSYGIKIEIE